MRDKTQLEFLLIRTELRTLFVTPPLLIATGAISEHSWESMISQPQWDESDTPLLMKPLAIENVISDQLQVLEEYRSTLSEIRESIEAEDQKDAHRFQIAVLASLANLNRMVTEGFRGSDSKMESVDTIQRTVKKCFSRFERKALRDENSEQPSIKEHDRINRGGEGIPVHAEDREDTPHEEKKDVSTCDEEDQEHPPQEDVRDVHTHAEDREDFAKRRGRRADASGRARGRCKWRGERGRARRDERAR
ncbi:hypothetical protein Y032_0632g874 [Ancylostoma ceylanicum]|uniref:Uncharacterized protein n=1 Tax=Ancylostoma ceylanicum TaxID=53326 RepID=A0A016WK70_9BILA|nr:hypothetical protein Y032_0632g874 [Ancylostoma ceylanicum]